MFLNFLTSISTFVLLASSFFVVLAVNAAKQEKVGVSSAWLVATAILGASFVGFQVYEFNHFYHEGLTLQGNLFGSTFYRQPDHNKVTGVYELLLKKCDEGSPGSRRSRRARAVRPGACGR